MEFRVATDRLAQAGVPLRGLADRLGISLNSLSRMRRAPTADAKANRNELRPPAGWEHELALLALEWAEQRASEIQRLTALAEEVRRGVGGISYPPSRVPGR